MQFKIRQTTASDLIPLLKIFESLSIADKYYLGLDLKYSSLINWIKEGKANLVLCRGKIVAFHSFGDSLNCLEELLVLPDYRRKGIARLILEKNKDKIEVIKTKIENEDMINLLKSLGFQMKERSFDNTVLTWKKSKR